MKLTNTTQANIEGTFATTHEWKGGELNLSSMLAKNFESGGKTVIHLNTPKDIVGMMMFVNAVREEAKGKEERPIINLHLPYFPYARQDRICESGEPFALRVMADIVNSLDVDKVTIYDPHSDVLPALITKNLEVMHQEDIFQWTGLSYIVSNYEMTIVSPDAGAEKKIKRVSEVCGNAPIVYCAKDRCPSTGKILDSRVMGDDVVGKDLLIVDDICDGGRTFIALGKKLLDLDAKSVSLYVTNGLFSYGVDELASIFGKIYCPFSRVDDERITILQLLL